MINEEFIFEKIEVLEWYDGIVRGIGAGRERYYLITLAAWKIDENKRLYLILDLDEESKRRIAATFEGKQSKEMNWETFGAVFDEFVGSYTGRVQMIYGDLVVGETYKGKDADPSFLNKLTPYDVQDTLQSANITFWFGQK